MEEDVSSLFEVAQAVYQDACAKCSAEVSDLRDLMTIRSRVECEGLSFLTLILPRFCQDFEKSLAAGRIGPACFAGFRKHGAIPAFLQGMLGRLFDRETGVLLNEANEDAPTLVEAVRQVCLLFKKVLVACTPARERAALDNFIEVEASFQDFQVSAADEDAFLCCADVLWSDMLGDLRLDMLLPRHGPGATAERISGNQKFVWRRWHERLEQFFPFIGFAMPLGIVESMEAIEELENVTFVPETDEDPVRVTLVPKTLKSPRVIAIEPVCMQYTQQAIQRELYRRIENGPFSAGQVSFTDQTKNQRLAVSSSKSGRYATIDLSDASDRVPKDLALRMFDSNPELRDAIDACRSRSAILPDGRRVATLAKFASMGSALCFPVEAMYFYTACVVALLGARNIPINRASVREVASEVYVYGDDLIVPTAHAEAVLDSLQRYNCKVNTSKTFLTGKFRESCGVDAYDGHEVTPTYVRRLLPKNRQQVPEMASLVATANQFYKRGYWRTATLLYSTAERLLGEELPYVGEDSSVLGRISFLGWRTISGWSRHLQAPTLRGWTVEPVHSSDYVDGNSALSKCLLALEERSSAGQDNLAWWRRASELAVAFTALSGLVDVLNPLNRDKKHLQRSVRRGAVSLKRRWLPVS